MDLSLSEESEAMTDSRCPPSYELHSRGELLCSLWAEYQVNFLFIILYKRYHWYYWMLEHI